MEDTGKNIGDILGLAPYGESLKIVTKGGVEGISKFLDITCRPLLEEFGLWARDHFRVWRFKNLYNVLSKAEGKVTYEEGQIMMVNPRLGYVIAENASLVEDDEIQEMWAGLFVSAITTDGKDDSNLLFANLLKQLTVIQARILNFAFENCLKVKSNNNLILGCKYCIEIDTLFEVCQISDLDRIDRELDSLRSLGLIHNGLSFDSTIADVTLKPLAIHLIARSKGIQSISSSLNFISEEEYKAHPEYHKSIVFG